MGRSVRGQWIRGPAADAAVALCWIPIAALAVALDDSPDALLTLFGGVFLLSFLHQPLTLVLVYGDPDQFALRRRLFTWTPPILVAAVLIGMHVSLPLVAVVAGLWNAEHTLMQRFGVTRMYARKAGEGREQAALDRLMLLSWLVLALVWVAADRRTPEHVAMVPLQQHLRAALDILHALRPVAVVLLAPVVATVLGLTGRWVLTERSRGAAASTPKRLYVASTAALFVVMLLHPIAGFAAYVGSHALEYFAIVHLSAGRRYAIGGGGMVGRVVRRAGAGGLIAAVVAFLLAVQGTLRQAEADDVVTAVVLAAGGMHLLYDGFIWKLRRPVVAQSLDLAPAAT